jgi:hypothetical protein
VSANRLLEFIERILPRLKVSFMLITHEGDVNIDSFSALADDPRILHWFAQNCLLDHPRRGPSLSG